MTAFSEFYDRAVAAKGGAATLEALLPAVSTPQQLAALADAECLAAMAKQVFRAGFSWDVIEKKWPDFEEVFLGFDPGRLAMADDGAFEAMASDKRIVRNFPKIKSVQENARFVQDVSAEHGGFGRFLAEWPGDDVVGLWDVLKKRGSRLGGNTGPMVLRMLGKDTFVLSDSVVKALITAGVVDKAPGSKGALAAVQEAFNRWHTETGRPLAHLSRILAASIP